MKIIPQEISPAGVQARKTSKAQGSKTANSQSGEKASAGEGDSVDISSTGSQLKSLGAQLKQVPDIRTERVQSLKAEVESGQYNPPADQVAQALIDTVRLFG
ncbi:flagellar biosynthesis anti-sigma factor FlgM [bacterium]|nr:flagellar biosynthesis anti-sigma factor FlgM [bacterium]